MKNALRFIIREKYRLLQSCDDSEVIIVRRDLARLWRVYRRARE